MAKRASGVISMTGFGSARAKLGGALVSVEIRSINARHLDLSLKLPRVYASIEDQVRLTCEDKIRRGRVECWVSREVSPSARSNKLLFNKTLFGSTLDSMSRDLKSLKVTANRNDLALALLRRSEFYSVEEQVSAETRELSLVAKLVTEAALELRKMQAKEGEHLATDMLSRISQLENYRIGLEKQLPVIRERLAARLQEAMQQLAGQVDPARLLQETALILERGDVTEELVRLGSHLKVFRNYLVTGADVGKKLDFLTQEILRELNTIGSKVQHAPSQHLIVEAKGEVEKIREQVQNIE